MYILLAEKRHLEDFKRLYLEFYKELRKKQGWYKGNEDYYLSEATKIFERKDIIFIAFNSDDDKPIGFIRLSNREDCFYIEEIFVKKEFRKQGVGKALVQKAEEYIKKISQNIYLLVLPQDNEAIFFWKRMGYDIINTIELVKNLETDSDNPKFHIVEFLGKKFKMYQWKYEKSLESEKRFLNILQRFYSFGGTHKEFIEIVSKALEEYLNK